MGWRTGGARAVRGAVAAAAGATLLACAGPAAGAFEARPVVDLFTDSRVEGVRVAASPLGDAVVGWAGPNGGPASVSAAFRSGDGPFGPVEPLTQTGNGEAPGFAFLPGGSVLAIWSHATTGAMGGWTTRTRTEPFATPAQSLPTGDRFAVVGADGAGTALAVWKSPAAGMNVVVASRRAVGGAFEPPVPLSGPSADGFIAPRVAVNAGGEAAVAWTRQDGGQHILEARVGGTAGPAFEALQTLDSAPAATGFLSAPEVAMGPSGEAIAVWTKVTVEGASQASSLQIAVRPPGATAFGSPQTLQADSFGARVGMDPGSGTAVIGLLRGPPQDGGAASAIVRPPGGPASPVAPLAPPPGPEGAEIHSVSFDASGAALVAWSRFLSDDVRLLEASRRQPGAGFQPAALIADMGPAAGSASVAAEPDGDAVAAWRSRAIPTAVVLRVGGLTFTPDPPGAGGGGPGAAAALPRACAGRRVTIVGTPRDDRIRGTARRDVIAALSGDDVVRGLGGGDVICAGPGRDRLLGGPGADVLRGEAGADTLLGGAGADLLLGGAGRDRLLGGPSRDRLLGGPAADVLLGGGSRDLLVGGPGRDRQIQ
jgi:hypothetical protein